MKRFFVTSLILFFSSTLCFSSSPKWITNLEKVYPSEKFIRAIGEGSSITLAKQIAVSELSSFFEQIIETQTFATKSISKNNLVVEEYSNLKQDFISSTKTEIFQVEYSEIYFNKKNQKYYVCAYINKEKLWKVICKKIELNISHSKIILNEIEKINEPLKKIFYYNQIKNSYDEFNKLYQIALCTYPKECDKFSKVLQTINEKIILLKNLFSEISVKINATGDKGKIIESKIYQLLSKNGFLISSQKGMYKLNAEIIWNENKFNGVYSSFPKIIFSIYKNSEIIKSFEIICEKCSAYNYQTLEKSEILLLESYLDNFFIYKFFE